MEAITGSPPPHVEFTSDQAFLGLPAGDCTRLLALERHNPIARTWDNVISEVQALARSKAQYCTNPWLFSKLLFLQLRKWSWTTFTQKT